MMKRFLPALLALVLVCAPGVAGGVAEGAATGAAGGVDAEAWLAAFEGYRAVFAEDVGLQEVDLSAASGEDPLLMRALSTEDLALSCLLWSDGGEGIASVELMWEMSTATRETVDAWGNRFMETAACAVLASAPGMTGSDFAGVMLRLEESFWAVSQEENGDPWASLAFEDVQGVMVFNGDVLAAGVQLILPETWHAPQAATAGVEAFLPAYAQTMRAAAGVQPLSLQERNVRMDETRWVHQRQRSENGDIVLMVTQNLQDGTETALFALRLDKEADAESTLEGPDALQAFYEHIAGGVIAATPGLEAGDLPAVAEAVLDAMLAYGASDALEMEADILGCKVRIGMQAAGDDVALAAAIYLRTP